MAECMPYFYQQAFKCSSGFPCVPLRFFVSHHTMHIVQYLQIYARTAGHLVDVWQWTSTTGDVNIRLRKMNVLLLLLVTLRSCIRLLYYNTNN